MVWKDSEHDELSHATIINRVDDEMIYYAAHTNVQFDQKILYFWENSTTAYKVHVIHLRDRVIV